MAFGVALSFSRIGSFANFNVSPAVVKATGVPVVLWIGVIVCAL
jgi:hypothetical protein